MAWTIFGTFVYILVGLVVANAMIEHTDYNGNTTRKEIRTWATIKILFSVTLWPVFFCLMVIIATIGMTVGILVQIRGTLNEIYQNIERIGKNEP